MAAWLFASLQSVNDPAGFGEYQQLAGATQVKYGGKLLGGGDKIEVMDGDWSPAAVAAIEFESLAKAKGWYHSSEYQAVLPKRMNTTNGGVVFVDGG